MTPNYYQNLLLDLNHEDHSSIGASSSASSSSLSPFYFNLPRDQAYHVIESKPSLQQQQVVDVRSYDGGASESKREMKGLKLTILMRREEGNDNNNNINHNNNQYQNGSSPSSSVKWMSSKMRLLRKMVKPEDDHSFTNTNSNSPSSTTIRVCADCNTTKTPLWRSGPQGPKSLCNACGIWQRKARRAAMAASGLTSAVASNSASKPNLNKETTRVQQTKKRSKTSAKPIAKNDHTRTNRKLCFEEFALSLSQKLSLHQVFPPDEKEAAILLMAMSCGLVEG